MISTDGLGVVLAERGGGKACPGNIVGALVRMGDAFLGSERKLSVFLRDALILELPPNAGFMMRMVL